MAGPLESEVEQLLNDATADTPLALESEIFGSGDLARVFRAWSPNERDEVLLLMLAGVSNRVRRIARAIDEANGSVSDDPGRD